MQYYIISIILFLLAVTFSLNKKDYLSRNYAISTYFCVLFFLFFGGGRYQVGADWTAYQIEYNYLDTFSDIFKSRFEKIYSILSFFIKNIIDNFSFFVFFFFFLSFIIKFSVIKKYSPNAFVSFLVYFYTVFIIYDINGIRQGFAIALTLYSIKFILQRDLIKFTAIIFLAYGFHVTALAFYPIYFLANLKFSLKKILLIFIILFFFVFLVKDLIKTYAINYLMQSDNISQYVVYAIDDSYLIDSPILSMGMIQRLSVFFIYMYSIKEYRGNNKLYLLLQNGYMIGIILFLFLSFSMEYAARISFYYKSLEILMLPIAVFSIKRRFISMMVIVVVFLFSLISIHGFLKLYSFGYLLPYNNVFLNGF